MASLGPMSRPMLRAAHSQDMIGCREFMEGKISNEFAKIQRAHCAVAPCRMNGDDWMRHFISHILHITHAQWIFRNTTLHDKVRGTLRLRERMDVLHEVERYIDTDPAAIPADSRFLLEIDFDSLFRSSFERQTYWVRAMRAAQRAGRRAALLQSRRGAGARRRADRTRQPRPRIDTSAVEAQLLAELTLRPLPSRRRTASLNDVSNPCNKRLCKPD